MYGTRAAKTTFFFELTGSFSAGTVQIFLLFLGAGGLIKSWASLADALL